MKLPDDFARARVLVVDDESANCRFLERLFAAAGVVAVTTTTDPREALRLFAEIRPDLVLLDIHMPHIGGIEVLSRIRRATPPDEYLPVIVLTGDVSRETREAAFHNGARDFLTKPLDAMEILLRSRNLLESRFLHLELDRKVRERTAQLEMTHLEVVERLSRTAEYRDDVTGEHTRRVGELAGRIAHHVGLGDEVVHRIRAAAPLHDLGKIGIPDQILLKPGPLTPDEFDVIKTHTTIGAELLSGGRSELMIMAEEIAGFLHVGWDGNGYPRRLRESEIPLHARIVAIADVFDALTHDRPYRLAQPVPEVVPEIRSLRNAHFDPMLVDAFIDARLYEPAAEAGAA